ncbi:MAG: phosphotransferase [Bacteroidales bacterium]|nr:phosphotransferase [Candidatus Cacconaster equifaecalis]
MEATRIDLAEWEYFGEGGSSTSYINKKDGNIVLKLCNKDIPATSVLKEYQAARSFNEAGFPSPAVYDFVTDGERSGYTAERIKGKISYARTLSQEPDSVENLARRFATLALELHRTPADVSKMTNARENLLNAMGDLSYVPEDVAEAVRKRFSSIREETACLHGDLNPGNLITFEGKDRWIGINEFAYGDPYLDIATMHIICNFLPAKSVSDLYHTDRSTLRKFFIAFKKAYFGENWDSKETNARIMDAAIVRFCAAAASNPGYTDILVPLVRGRRIMFLIKRGV